MNYHLVCAHAFGPYKVGDRIEEADQVAMMLAGPNGHFFVKVSAPAQTPAAAVAAAPMATFDE